eukprot:4096551-Prymnesium_polylepis.1
MDHCAQRPTNVALILSLSRALSRSAACVSIVCRERAVLCRDMSRLAKTSRCVAKMSRRCRGVSRARVAGVSRATHLASGVVGVSRASRRCRRIAGVFAEMSRRCRHVAACASVGACRWRSSRRVSRRCRGVPRRCRGDVATRVANVSHRGVGDSTGADPSTSFRESERLQVFGRARGKCSREKH